MVAKSLLTSLALTSFLLCTTCCATTNATNAFTPTGAKAIERNITLLKYCTSDKAGNRIASATGLHNVLTLLVPAARSTSLTELTTYLGQDQSTLAPTSSVTSSNLFLVRTDHARVEMKPAYQRLLTQRYQAKAYLFPVAEAANTAQEANKFIAKRSNNLITDFFAPVNLAAADYVSSLVNVLTFASAWQEPCESYPNFKFQLASGKTVTTAGLTTTDATYVASKKFIGMRKAYQPQGRGDHNYSFYALLPRDEGNNLNLAELKVSELKVKPEIDLTAHFPRFSFGARSDLNKYLLAQGVKTIFDKHQADLTAGFTCPPEENVYVGLVEQEAKIEVTEEGTQAAAVSAVHLNKCLALPPRPRKKIALNFNRPFFFLIYDETAQMPLFVGEMRGI